MQCHSFFIGLVLVVCGGCPTEAEEDLQSARQDLKKAGHELGEAARKTAAEVDEAAAQAGVRVSERIETAMEDLDATRRAIDLAAGGLSQAPPDSSGDQTDDAIRCATERYAVDRQLYDATLANPLPLAGKVVIEPVEGTGTLAGYRLTAVESGSIAARLGFVPGDVIVAVNGRPLDQPPPAEMLTELQAADEVTVTVERDGQRFEKTIEIHADQAAARGG